LKGVFKLVDEPKEQPKEEVKESQEIPDVSSEINELRSMITELKDSFKPIETLDEVPEVYEAEESPELESKTERTDWKSKYEKAQRTLTAQETAKKVLAEHEHANKKEIERLVAIGASEKAIKRAAEISEEEFVRGQKSVIDKLSEKEQELAKKYEGAWGHPDSGEVGGGEGVLTAERMSKMSPAERKAAAEKMPFKGRQIAEEIDWK